MGEVLPIAQPGAEPEKKPDSGPEIIVLKFADSKIPVFKETRDKDYIKYGDNNLYPDYLTYLFNKSAKHNAILTGKANYIFGKGYENGDIIVNRTDDSLNDIAQKALLDIEIYGGFRLEIIWSKAGKIAEIYHVDFSSIRKGKDGGFFFKETWEPYKAQEVPIPSFNPSNPVGSQIFEYNQYRPGVRYYPLPGYIGCNNYIETDIEISKYYLSAIRNGMNPSKLIQFFKGEPTEEKKKQIEKRLSDKFAGAENAGKFILVFNDSNATKSVEVNDLSGSDLDKMFVELNKTCQQEIFSGHLVTSPMLFGIKTEGQLGGNTELQTAYNIFQNTYSKPRAKNFDKEINWLLKYSMFPGTYELKPTDPIGLQFDIKDVVTSLPKKFVFKELGIPEDLWEDDTIGGDAGLAPTTAASIMSNDNVKNMSAKQHQQLTRIIRQYNKGQLTEQAAKVLLRTGLGLNEDDINSILGITPVAMAFEDQREEIIGMFDACGESKNDFEIIKSKRVNFSSESEAAGDEPLYMQEAFKGYDVTATENKIIELIKKDPRITSDVIATAVKETIVFVESKLKSLEARGYIEKGIETVGIDTIVKRTIPKDIDIKLPPSVKNSPTQIFVKYSYEGPVDSRNRPFCAKMMALNRLYSRFDIEKISQRLGYSVFDRGGGFWNTGTEILPHCRHHWKSNIVIKKGGTNES